LLGFSESLYRQMEDEVVAFEKIIKPILAKNASGVF
jgi:hypothetical protein